MSLLDSALMVPDCCSSRQVLTIVSSSVIHSQSYPLVLQEVDWDIELSPSELHVSPKPSSTALSCTSARRPITSLISFSSSIALSIFDSCFLKSLKPYNLLDSFFDKF